MDVMGPPSLLPDSRTGAAEIDRPPRDSPAPFPSRSPTHDRVGGRDVVGRRRPEATMTNPGDDIYGSAEHQAFRETVRKFVQAELVPRDCEFDELGRFDKSLYRKMGDLGLLGIRYDQRYGGLGLDYSYHAIFLEELSLCDNAGVAMGISVQTDMATPALHRFGSEELKQRYLVPAIRGEQVAAIAVTEPGPGSDVAGIKTPAVRGGGHWGITGPKIFIPQAATAGRPCPPP